MFITFEGIEGCGKTTQVNKLKKYFESLGREVLVTLEPGGSRLGQTLRKILLSMDSQDLTREAELFLYLADRAQHVDQIIRPALKQGKVVISDRYADSTIVYQGYGRGLDTQTLHSFNEMATRGLWPDLTILLDLPVEIGLKRAVTRNLQTKQTKDEGRFEAESIEFHARVREGYLTWAALNKNRFIIIDATGSADDVFKQILKNIKSNLV
jgi:dTMP kinase